MNVLEGIFIWRRIDLFLHFVPHVNKRLTNSDRTGGAARGIMALGGTHGVRRTYTAGFKLISDGFHITTGSCGKRDETADACKTV